MPKKAVDYSNTVIYKIYCKDPAISDLYVGHTTNFIQRKYGHKIACNNNKQTERIYTAIRNHGGWDNWDMVEIATYCCKNSTEARIKEQQHYDELKASLNTHQPFVYKNPNPNKETNINESIDTSENVNISNEVNIYGDNTINNVKNTIDCSNKHRFCCVSCKYYIDKKSSFDKHILTSKHQKLSHNNNIPPTENENNDNQCNIFKICNKTFKSRTGLWKHKKGCFVKKDDSNNENNDKQLLTLLLADHIELKKEIGQLKELILNIISKNI